MNKEADSVLQRSELYLSTQYQAPANEAEKRLADIWSRVMNIDQLGTSDDFFELGGDSLKGTILASEIEQEFQCKFSPSSLVELSTITAQAAYVDNGDKSDMPLPGNMTGFNLSGSKPPLFLIHGAIGFTLYDKRFLDLLDKDQPAIFIEAIGLDGKEEPLKTMDEYVQRYLQQIEQVVDGKEWVLAANCRGSLVAIEICRFLEKEGKPVPRLLMVDPDPRLFRRRNVYESRRQKLKENLILLRKKLYIRDLKHLIRKIENLYLKIRFGIWDKGEDPEFEDELVQRHKLQKHNEKQSRKARRISERIQNESSMVDSQVSYNADSMKKVFLTFKNATNSHKQVLQPWEGTIFLLRTQQWREIGVTDDVKKTLPNVIIRSTPYRHQGLFKEGLEDVVKFLHDGTSVDPIKRFS